MAVVRDWRLTFGAAAAPVGPRVYHHAVTAATTTHGVVDETGTNQHARAAQAAVAAHAGVRTQRIYRRTEAGAKTTSRANVATTIVRATPPPTGTTNAVYGPNGAEWAPTSVSDGINFNIVVTSVSGLLSAIAAVTTAQANAGYRIGIANGVDLAPSSTLTIPQNSALDAASQAILVRAVTPGQVKATNGIWCQCSNLTIAYLDLYANFMFRTSPQNTWLTRCHGIGAASINLHTGLAGTTTSGGANCGLVGCVYPDNPTAAEDRLHLSPDNSSAGPGRAMDNFSFIRCWFEGMHLPSGSTYHADMMQIDGLYGTMLAQNCYFGPAGNNGNPQAKADIFDNYKPFCTVSYENCLQAGAYVDGQGNASNQSGPHRGTNNVYFDNGSMAFRFNSPLVDTGSQTTTPNCVLTNCTFYGSVNGSGTGLTNNNPTFLPASPKPNPASLYVKPPWQWW